jgi:uncharacterized protein YdaU (DUF1376 family)
MSRAPAFQFYPADYQRDTRVLTAAGKGVWMDVLCTLWWTPENVRQKTMTAEEWSRTCGVTVDEFCSVLDQFERHAICDVKRNGNGEVTLKSRRMLKDDPEREKNRKRKAKFDALKKKERSGNAMVTDKSQHSSSSSSSSVTKVTLSSEGDSIHQILKQSEVLSGITYEQDLEARRAAGFDLKDPRLAELANTAVREALLMGDLDHPAMWWRRMLERSRAGSSPGSEKKEPPAPKHVDDIPEELKP